MHGTNSWRGIRHDPHPSKSEQCSIPHSQRWLIIIVRPWVLFNDPLSGCVNTRSVNLNKILRYGFLQNGSDCRSNTGQIWIPLPELNVNIKNDITDHRDSSGTRSNSVKSTNWLRSVSSNICGKRRARLGPLYPLTSIFCAGHYLDSAFHSNHGRERRRDTKYASGIIIWEETSSGEVRSGDGLVPNDINFIWERNKILVKVCYGSKTRQIGIS